MSTNAIVMNTLNGAVSEYSGFDFHAITPTHAGSAGGLYELGGEVDFGDTDAETDIVSIVTTPKTLMGTSKRTSIDGVFFSIKGSGTSTLTVYGESVSYTYEFQVLDKGVSRATVGRGFRENYAAFGYSNADGADFQLDQIEVLNGAAQHRRTA